MPEQNPSIDNLNKAPEGQMSSDDHAAALGFITTLSEGLLPQDQPQDGQNGQDGQPQDNQPPQQDTTPADQADPQQDIKSVEDNIITEIRGLKSELNNADMQQEFQAIKQELKTILNNDTPEETKS